MWYKIWLLFSLITLYIDEDLTFCETILLIEEVLAIILFLIGGNVSCLLIFIWFEKWLLLFSVINLKYFALLLE